MYKQNLAVDDLGLAAFARMKGYKCTGRKGRTFYFNPGDDVEKFLDLNIEYINSPYHDFDACIMSLRKVADRIIKKEVRAKSVSDLGAAAFIKLHGFICLGKKLKNYYFEVSLEDQNKFDSLSTDYINSQYHDFDACIMSLKKLNDFLVN